MSVADIFALDGTAPHTLTHMTSLRFPGFAISTPSFQNFVGPGVSERAAAYGIRAIRVDGGDILAVYTAVQEARRMALEGNCPCLVEVISQHQPKFYHPPKAFGVPCDFPCVILSAPIRSTKCT